MKKLAIAAFVTAFLSSGVAYAQNAKQICRQSCQQAFQACMRDAGDSAAKKNCFDSWKACNEECR